jgi:hypothetical protein
MCRRFCSIRRRHSSLLAVPPARPFAVLVDRHALGERLALADPHFGRPIEQEVVDLRGEPVDLDPQVVDGRPVLRPTEIQLDVVRRILLGSLAGLDVPDLHLDPLPRRLRDVGSVKQPFELDHVLMPSVCSLDLHQPSPVAFRGNSGDPRSSTHDRRSCGDRSCARPRGPSRVGTSAAGPPRGKGGQVTGRGGGLAAGPMT